MVRDDLELPDLLLALGTATLVASLALPWVTVAGARALRGYETAEAPAVVAVTAVLVGVGVLERLRTGDWGAVGITALGLAGAFVVLFALLYARYPARGFGGGPPAVAAGWGLYVTLLGGAVVFGAGLVAAGRVLWRRC